MPTKNGSRRRPPAQDGGILAALSSNVDSIRTPPKTLIVSKKCDAISCEDEEDISILDSPCLEHSSEESLSEEGDSDEETDDESSTEISENSSSNASIESCSVAEEDLEIDQYSSNDDEEISEKNTEEIMSDFDEESEFDPDGTLSDDDELEADEESLGKKPVKTKENFTATVDAEILDQNDYSESDDEAISVIAEIIEDSDMELSCSNDTTSEKSFDSPADVESHHSIAPDLISAEQILVPSSELLHGENEQIQKTNHDGQDDETCEEHRHTDTDGVPQGTTRRDLRQDGEVDHSTESSASASNWYYPESQRDSSERKHKDREITFHAVHESKADICDHNESAGMLCSDAPVSPIKSGFTPKRLSQGDRSAGPCIRTSQSSLDANVRLGAEDSARVSLRNFSSTNPSLFSPILAHSTRNEKNSTTSGTSLQLPVHTPPEKTARGDESPIIERSINRAIRSLLQHDKASKRTKVRKGEWVLGAKLGSGAFGVVHVGMNTSTGSLMAVKSIRMENVATEDVRREIELLKSLEHPNIVVYHGAEMDRKYLHIFQEWVPGGSLCSMLSKFGSFRRAVLRNYLSQIIEGLEYLHDQRVMHRDLKGSNVLVSDAGVVKLADFGSSKRFDGFEGNMMMSLTMRGTPYFMAPEVFEEKYSFKADIWSVGCIAFQMATASPPWKDMGYTNPVALFNHVKATDCIPQGKIDFDDSLNFGGNGASLTSLLEKCFRRNPAERPNAAELLCEPFFEKQSSFSDDNEVQGKYLFGRSPLNESVTHSPFTAKISPIASGFVRRNSLSSLDSPLCSPPVPITSKFAKNPLPRSPQPDPKNWPSWARDKHQEGSSDKFSDNTYTVDSLAYSSGKTGDHSITNSPLMGLKFLNIS